MSDQVVTGKVLEGASVEHSCVEEGELRRVLTATRGRPVEVRERLKLSSGSIVFVIAATPDAIFRVHALQWLRVTTTNAASVWPASTVTAQCGSPRQMDSLQQ